MATIGWYGPLIDLSEAASHNGHFVQLVVFVHKTIPAQYKSSSTGGKVIRTDIQVGDDTRRYFAVSIWQKHMLKAGSIVLLHNVKVTRYGDVVVARTVQQSSIQCLVDTYESIPSEGVDNVMKVCHIGIVTKEKLKKVITWVLRVEPILDKHAFHTSKRNPKTANWKFPEETQNNEYLSLLEVSDINDSCKRNPKTANWKFPEETQNNEYLSLLEVYDINDSCKVSFFASVGEMFLPITNMHPFEFKEERMFIRNRIFTSDYGNLVEDLICTGCQLCGAPLNFEFGSRIEQEIVPLYCGKSSNRLHIVSLIYRPFVLFVWNEFTYIPVVVKNKAAEILLGNIKAESVHSSYKKQSCGQSTNTKENEAMEDQCQAGLNFYSLWLILLKTLLCTGKNNPLNFKVRVDMSKNWENGRFEMLCVSLPTIFQIAN